MKAVSAVFLVLLACLSNAVSQENYQQWNSFKYLSINTTPSGVYIANNVMKFPLLIRLTSANADVFSSALGNGADVRFSKSNGIAPLSYQIERWDSAGKVAEIWVLMDTIYGNQSTQSIRMYWGKKGAADSSNGAVVFDTSNGFVGVWHLAENGNAAAQGYKDATLYHHHGTGIAMNNGSNVAGRIGMGSNFNGSDQYISVPNSDALNINRSITVSAWFFANEWTSGNHRILQKGNADNQYSLRLEGGQFEWQLSGTNGSPVLLISPPNAGGWHLVHATYDFINATTAIYVNGALLSSQNNYGTIGTGTITDILSIGGKPRTVASGDYFTGIMDEVRLQNKPRYPDWIRLEYETQNSPATVVTLGSTQTTTGIIQKTFLASHRLLGDKSATLSLIDIRGRVLKFFSTFRRL